MCQLHHQTPMQTKDWRLRPKAMEIQSNLRRNHHNRHMYIVLLVLKHWNVRILAQDFTDFSTTRSTMLPSCRGSMRFQCQVTRKASPLRTAPGCCKDGHIELIEIPKAWGTKSTGRKKGGKRAKQHGQTAHNCSTRSTLSKKAA